MTIGKIISGTIVWTLIAGTVLVLAGVNPINAIADLGLFSTQPKLKVWVDVNGVGSRSHIPAYTLVIQNMMDRPVEITGVLANNKPSCILRGSPPLPKTLNMGEKYLAFLGPQGMACDLVKVVVSTDRGDASFDF